MSTGSGKRYTGPRKSRIEELREAARNAEDAKILNSDSTEQSVLHSVTSTVKEHKGLAFAVGAVAIGVAAYGVHKYIQNKGQEVSRS